MILVSYCSGKRKDFNGKSVNVLGEVVREQFQVEAVASILFCGVDRGRRGSQGPMLLHDLLLNERDVCKS